MMTAPPHPPGTGGHPHPFDLVFGPVADEWLPAIQAESAGTDLSDITRFAKLQSVETILAQMRPPDAADVTEQTEEHLRLVYAAYHFWAGGRRDRAAPRNLLDRESRNVVPALDGCVYCRVAERQFWAQVEKGSPHEPLDGFFAVTGGRGGAEWVIVAVLGLRSDRGGFSQVSLTASAADVASAQSPRDLPFAPAMEGGIVAGFHSITSVAELLMLVRLALVSAEQ